MKKILVGLILLSFVFSANANIRAGNTGGKVISGYQFYQMEVKDTVAPTADIIWYVDNLAGYSSVDIYFTGVSSGDLPSTISATPVYSNGDSVTDSQTITAGTSLTDFKSTYYKFTLPAIATTRNVSFNFIITD